MLQKGDIIIITKVNDNIFSYKYKNRIEGSIAKVANVIDNDIYLEFPELNNIRQCCYNDSIEYILIKNKNKNIVKDLYKKAKIGGFTYANK